MCREEPEDEHGVTEHLDDGAERLEEQEVGDSHEPETTVPGVEQHIPVGPQRLPQTSVPAIPLATQHSYRRRDFGPTDGIGREQDPIFRGRWLGGEECP